MSFRITGLAAADFQHLFGLADADLARHGAVRRVCDTIPGFPDRIGLRDAEPGETLLLVNHTHQPADTPYRASHAVYVAEGARESYDALDRVPEMLRLRMLSVRAFDAAHFLADADLVDGRALEGVMARLFADPAVAYLHLHFAKPGCYAARAERAD